MSNTIRTESWCGYDIRFVDVNGEWYAILKDICDALGLKSKHVSQRLDPSMMERVRIEDGSNDLNSRGAKSFWMLMESVTVAGGDVEQVPFEE